MKAAIARDGLFGGFDPKVGVLRVLETFVASGKKKVLHIETTTNLDGCFIPHPPVYDQVKDTSLDINFTIVGKRAILTVSVPFLVDINDDEDMEGLGPLYNAVGGFYDPYCLERGMQQDIPIVDDKPVWPENVHLFPDGHNWIASIKQIDCIWSLN